MWRENENPNSCHVLKKSRASRSMRKKLKGLIYCDWNSAYKYKFSARKHLTIEQPWENRGVLSDQGFQTVSINQNYLKKAYLNWLDCHSPAGQRSFRFYRRADKTSFWFDQKFLESPWDHTERLEKLISTIHYWSIIPAPVLWGNKTKIISSNTQTIKLQVQNGEMFKVTVC